MEQDTELIAPTDRSARKNRKRSNGSVAGSADQKIYNRIYVAILEHRLPPGTKLGEDRLAKIFGVSRARIRDVLARLAHEGVVELFPQRGAHVARPTPEQAREIFEMRRLIEPGIVRKLVANLTPDQLKRLRLHLDQELESRQTSDMRAVIRLSGEFHNLLAELAGNRFLTRSMRELSTLTCLIISLYDAPTAEACREDEHAAIIDAIAEADAERACNLITEHLDHIEASLDLTASDEEVDLERVFAG